MTKTYRKLTGKEKRQIRKLVVFKCANYDKEYGKHFQKNGKRAYCSDKCAAEARRKQTAARV